jgi:hypothetical protein
MSRFHGEQSWTEIRMRAVRDWRAFDDDDIDTLHAVRHEREVRARDDRGRARICRRSDEHELEA